MDLFASAFGLGLAIVASPGAVTAQVIRRGLERGFFAALLLQLGALIGLGVWAAVALVGATLLARSAPARLVLGMASGVLLLLLMGHALKDAYRGKVIEAKSSLIRGDFALGAALSLLNPLPLAFWLGAGSSLIPIEATHVARTAMLTFFAGLISGALVWSIFLASLLAWGKHFITPPFFRLVNLACGVAFGFFGLKLLWNSILLL